MTDLPHNGPDNGGGPDGGGPDGGADSRAGGGAGNGGEPAAAAAGGPSPDLLARAGGRRRPVIAAVAVLAAAGLVLAIVLLTRPDRSGDAGAAAPRQLPLAELVVRDGDLASASGEVFAVSGQPVRLCYPRGGGMASAGTTLDEAAAGAPDGCAGITLVGADLGKLADREELPGSVSGYARVEGRYRAGTLTVTRQTVPTAGPVAGLDDPPAEPTPCPPPAAGWMRTQLDTNSTNRLDGYLAAHPDRYGAMGIGYPDGRPAPSTEPVDQGDNKTEVALVGTVLDPATARQELATVFTGNLCVTRIAHSRTQVDAIGKQVSALMDTTPQISQDGPDYYHGRFDVELIVLDQAMYDKLSKIDGNTGIIAAQPWLRPLGR